MNQNSIPNLLKACEVMRQIADNEGGLAQSEIEELVNLPRATAFRILNTLRIEGFAEKKGKRYFAGVALVQFGIKKLASVKINEIARPVLERLSFESGETSHLAVESGPHSLIIEVSDSPNPIRVSSRPGSLADIHCSSTGKVFLANKSEEQAVSILERVELNRRTSKTITFQKKLIEDLAKVRELGYAIDDEEYFDGVRCLAAPIRDMKGNVVAAIGITGTASRFTEARNYEIANMVIEAADEVATKLSE